MMHKKGLIPMITGLLLIVAALSLTGYNLWDSHRAGQSAAGILQELDIPSELQRAPETPKWDYISNHTSGGSVSEVPHEMATQQIDGQHFIGVLDVPVYQLKLPVISSWDYDKLELAPCVYSGSYYTDDLVICGHNYSTHFSRLKYIPLGEDIYFTTVDGYLYHYTVDNVETVQPSAIQQMISGDWDLTLFTCHTGGQTRCAVRCIRLDE